MTTVLGIVLLFLAVLTGMARPAAAQPLAQLKLLVPANPGGGWDQTGRAMERALREEKLVTGAVRITNRGGAGDAIGLAELAKAKGDGTSLMVMGLVMVGAIQTNNWDDAYLGGDGYAAFIKAENDRISKVLKDVGLVK
jgi:tripartite-type tricarboxylate transporter receptor subunit TctC